METAGICTARSERPRRHRRPQTARGGGAEHRYVADAITRAEDATWENAIITLREERLGLLGLQPVVSLR